MGVNQDKIQFLQSEETNLKREISLFGGISILAGIMVGSGIFYIGSYVLLRTGLSLGLALLVWIIGGIVTMLSGLCYAELGAMMPKAGGQYVYLREAFGEKLAFMSGFSSFVLGSSGSIAALAIAFSMVLSNFFTLTNFQIKLTAIVIIIILTLLNIRGIKLSSLVQNIFLVGKIIPIVIIIGFGLIKGSQSPNLSLIPASGESVSLISTISMIAFAVIATLWAYEGWTNLNTISEEIKSPKKNIPLAIIIAISSVTLLYTIFHYSIYKTISPEIIESSLSSGNYYLGAEAAKILLGKWGMLIVNIGMSVSIFGALNGCIMVFPRSYYAMAKDNLFFNSYKTVHPKYKTPHNAIIGSMIISILLIFMRNLDQLTLLVIFSGSLFNALTFISVLKLRKKYPTMTRPYKVWGGKITVIITTTIMILLSINTLIEDPISSTIGLIVPILGLLIYKLTIKTNENYKKNDIIVVVGREVYY